MCGILGVDSVSDLDEGRFKSSLALLNHRGPDFSDYTLVTSNSAIGHARLAIIDLDPASNQPFKFAQYTLSYNGEIYNYIELRDELVALGHEFTTDGDTEVVLKAYIEWGKDALKKFNGMWAFVIHDAADGSFFCSRDRFGIKPFYYSLCDEFFCFSSEIRPLLNYFSELRKPNFQALQEFFLSGVGGQREDSFFDGIDRLLPGHYMIVKDHRVLKRDSYWSYPRKRDSKVPFEKAKEEVQALLIDSVRIRLRSDVQVFSTITSGLDSTTIVAIFNKLDQGKVRTFTSYSRESLFSESERSLFVEDLKLNEASFIEKIKDELSIQPKFIELGYSDYLKRLFRVIEQIGEPHSSQAIVSVDQMYSEIGKEGRVLLEGQGADELFGGYVYEFMPYYLWHELKLGKIGSAFSEIRSLSKVYPLKEMVKSFVNAFLVKKGFFRFKIKSLGVDVIGQELKFKKRKRKDDVLTDMHSSGLVNLLHYGDSLSMAHSIESRFPFMDYRLVEYVQRLPLNYFLNGARNKFLLREAVKDIIPSSTYNNKLKLGFISPTDRILRDDLGIKEVLYEVDNFAFFDQQKLNKLLDKFYAKDFNNISIIYKILVIKIWMKIFFNNSHD